MKLKGLTKVGALSLAMSAGWSLYFVLTIANIKYAPVATGVFASLLVASIFTGFFYGRIAYHTARSIISAYRESPASQIDTLMLTLSGISIGMAFFLQAAKRSTFAPSGSDVAFLLATPPLFIIIFAAALKLDKLTWGKLTGSAAALLGVIAIVGNWERPSSFSPFSLFVEAESLILLASISLAVFAVTVRELLKRYPATALSTLALWLGTLVMGIVSVMLDGPSALLAVSADGWIIFAMSGMFTVALTVFLLCNLLATTSISRASAALYLLPVLVTALIGIEKAFGFAYMATPFMWMPIIIGSLITVMGVVAVWAE